MTLTRSFIRNAVTTPLDARSLLMGLVTVSADGTPRAGVLGGANPSIVTALATMHVAIAAAEFVTTKGRSDGVAIFANDGVVNVPIPAAPVSNSRIDVIYVKHNDNTTGDADALPFFGVASGAAAASPLKPSIPTGALELATLRVYSGTTAANGGTNTLLNTYQMTAPRGAIVPFRTKVDLDAWANAVTGQPALVLADGKEYRRVSGAWNPISSASVVTVASGHLQAIPQNTDTTVVFPPGSTTVSTVKGNDLSFDPATGVVTALVAGTYKIEGEATWAAGGIATSHVLTVAKNAGGLSSPVGEAVSSLRTFNTNEVMSVGSSFDLVPGDTLRMRAFQASAASKALGVAGGAYYKTLTVTKVG